MTSNLGLELSELTALPFAVFSFGCPQRRELRRRGST
jgi:hypothetical protein